MLRFKNPFHAAFYLTCAAALLLVSGSIGYNLSKSAETPRWSEHFIWWQLLVGLAVLPAAAYWWRKALRNVGR